MHPQAAVELLVHIAEDHREMGPAPLQARELPLGQGGDGVGQGADAQGDEHLIAVEAGVLVAKAAGLQPADGLQNLGGDEVQILVDPPPGP